jgi:hypothetical protein
VLIISGHRRLVNDRFFEVFKGFGPIRPRDLTEQCLRGRMKAMKLFDQYEAAWEEKGEERGTPLLS